VYDTSPAGLGLSPTYLSSATASASSSTTTAGTIFPTSPADGNIFIYLADATNGVNWAFKYNAGSASTYKWEFIGGPPILATVETDETTTSTSYTDLSTTGPTVTIARAGNYYVRSTLYFYNTSSTAIVFSSIKVGSSGAPADYDGPMLTNAMATQEALVSGVSRIIGTTASDSIRMQYRVSSGTGHFARRRIEVLPQRVI
jgi:hypothetical protein